MESMNYEIAMDKDEIYIKQEKKPYVKHKLEGGTRIPTRLEYLFYKHNLKKNNK